MNDETTPPAWGGLPPGFVPPRAKAPKNIRRWAVRIEYDGRDFVGWQRQASGLTSVQGVLEAAATRLTGGRPVISITAGRTDSGVHATGQVAHLDFPDDIPLSSTAVRDALNYHMKPHRVAILIARPVLPNWSARFSAILRSYRYRIINRSARPTLDEGRVWHVRQPLDVDLMRQAAQFLIGRHDFTTFRATACQAKSPVRTLDRLDIHREGEEIVIVTEARAFLHHQVRNMTGTLKMVGEGSWSVERVGQALAACDRRAGGPTAPAEGLYLTGVAYPEDPFAK